MNTNRLNQLLKRWNENKEKLEAIETANEGADLTADEQAEVDALMAVANELKPLIEKARADSDLLSSVAAMNVSVTEAKKETTDEKELTAVGRDSRIVGAADYLFNFLRYEAFNDQNAGMKLRALQSVASSSSPGFLPYTIVGDVLSFIDANRYVINSLRRFPVPAGSQFLRQVVSNTRHTFGVQVNEGDEISSVAFPTVSLVTVQHDTIASGLSISIQAEAFNSPSLMDAHLRWLAEDYAIKTDAYVAAALKAAVTTGITGDSTDTPGEIIATIYQAADLVYATSKTQADTIWVSPSVRSWLATRVGSDGHPAFPTIAPNNRMGTQSGAVNWTMNVAGLDVVVGPSFATDTFIVGASRYGEVYESQYPLMRAAVPRTLTTEVAMSGEIGTYFRPEAFVKIVDTDSSATPNFG